MSHPRSIVKELHRNLLRGAATAILLMLCFVGANFVATIFMIWTPTFLVEKFNLDLAKAALWATAFISIASAISAPIGGVLADLASRRLALCLREDGRRRGTLALGVTFWFIP